MTQKAQVKPHPLEILPPLPPGGLYCSYCRKNIENQTYYKCAKCIGFNLCLECASIAAEQAPHVRTHPFYIIEPLPETVYREGWKAEEELLLLHAVQVCGIGNWHEIENIVRTKDANECKVHYLNTYIRSPTAPMPLDTILPPAALPAKPSYDTTGHDSRPSISHDKNLADRGKKDKTTPAESAGWMPRRGEYENEYLNDAEALVANITFSDNEENPHLFAQKLKCLRTYNEILHERKRRSEFVLTWDLVDEDFKSFGGRTKADREMEDTLLPLACVTGRPYLTKFIKMLEKEREMIDEYETLIDWRKNGIVTRDEGLMFQELKAMMHEDRLTQAQVEKWNRDAASRVESADFRAARDRQLLNTAESALCEHLTISPAAYLKLKDIIIREFTMRGKLTREEAATFVPSNPEIGTEVFDYLQKAGLLWVPGAN